MAGYLEGRATAQDILNFYDNMRGNNPNIEQFKKMKQFFTEVVFNIQKKLKNIDSIQENQKLKWSRMLLGYAQLEGLLHSYTYEMKRLGKYNDSTKLDLADLLILQADGEVPELIRYFRSYNSHTKIGDKDYFKEAFGINTRDPKDFWSKLMMESKCSAFIKITKNSQGNWNDLLVGHTTWAFYYEMLRSYKK